MVMKRYVWSGFAGLILVAGLAQAQTPGGGGIQALQGPTEGIQAIGDPTQDFVYTPITPPCRLFDTRVSQGGLGTPTLNVRRTYGATTPVANQGGPGGCAAGAGAAVALIQLGSLNPSSPGLLQGGQQGAASLPNALLLYEPGEINQTAVAMPLNVGNGQFDLVEQFGTADLYGDLVGYFRAPLPTVQKQVYGFIAPPGAQGGNIPIPVVDVPVTVQVAAVTLGYRGVSTVTILRCCSANPNSFLEWVGLSSTAGAAIVQGFSAAAGTLVTPFDYAHQMLLEVRDANSLQVHNTSTTVTHTMWITVTW
jgi:hypothetical protein